MEWEIFDRLYSVFHSLSFFNFNILLNKMDEGADIPVGVKMLADHLVKVKLEYEGIHLF